MAYLKTQGVDRLTLPSDPEYWVELKAKATYGDTIAAYRAMFNTNIVDLRNVPEDKIAKVQANPGDTTGIITESELDTYYKILISRLIVNWNLTDENERPLPINPETIELLDPEDGSFLQKEAQKRIQGRSAEAEGPLGKPSPVRSKGSK
jgi:hypothetical protein